MRRIGALGPDLGLLSPLGSSFCRRGRHVQGVARRLLGFADPCARGRLEPGDQRGLSAAERLAGRARRGNCPRAANLPSRAGRSWMVRGCRVRGLPRCRNLPPWPRRKQPRSDHRPWVTMRTQSHGCCSGNAAHSPFSGQERWSASRMRASSRLRFRFVRPGAYFSLVWPLSLATSTLGSALFAWAASRFFVEARRTGEIELLLTTPVGAKQIVSTQWQVLKRSAPLADAGHARAGLPAGGILS